MLKLALAFALVTASAPALALSDKPPLRSTPTDLGAGWALRDSGRKPGDDSEREITIQKNVPHLRFSYSPTETNGGGNITLHFDDFPKCSGLNFSSGFGFDDPPADRAAAVRERVHYAFIDYAKECKTLGTTEAVLMDGFGPAFAAIEKLMADEPYVYPNAASSR